MGLFKQKRDVGVEEFCQEYYDRLFHTTIAEEDVRNLWLDTVFDSLVEADKSFEVIDRNLFCQEINALHLEIFALAWMHKFKKGEKYTIQQSIFTQHYLEDTGKLSIWDAMQRYNHAVAQTATMTSNGKHMVGDTGTERLIINRVNNTRVEFMRKWGNANIKDLSNLLKKEETLLNCVARVSNRIEADLMKNKEIGNRRLAALFLYRLGWEEDKELSEEALFRLAALTFGFYKDAMDVLKGINLYD